MTYIKLKDHRLHFFSKHSPAVSFGCTPSLTQESDYLYFDFLKLEYHDDISRQTTSPSKCLKGRLGPALVTVLDRTFLADR